MPPTHGDVQWFPNEIRRLILAIKKHEGIYNPVHQEFGMRDSQSKSWKAVAEEVSGGKTDLQCRDKWNCLRGTYRRHVRTEATNNVRRRSGWPWADMMSFLKKHVLDRDEMAELRQKHYEKAKRQKCRSPSSPQVTVSSAGNPPGLTFTGGIILNGNRVGIVQKPSVGVVQPSKSVGKLADLGIVQPVQTNLGLRMVHTTQPGLIINQPKMAVTVSKTKKSSEELDLNPAKTEEDVAMSPAGTEFVDIDYVEVKREPMEEEEVEYTEDYNFLSEESSQSSSVKCNNDPSLAKSTKSDDNWDSDTNELFMRSTVSHMRMLSAFDQSVFKLKVQQLLHDMMFPVETTAGK